MPVSKSYEAYINVKDVPEGKSISKYRNVYVDVNDFINDNYTESDVHTWSTKKINSIIPKNLSGLINDAGFITEEEALQITESFFKQIALNYYLKSEVYTKEELDEILEKFTNMKIEKVSELPEIGDSETIYLLAKEDPTDDKDTMDEYLFIDGKWEFVGGVGDIDLSNIYTREETDAEISKLIDDSSLSSTSVWSSEKIVEYLKEYILQLDGNNELY